MTQLKTMRSKLVRIMLIISGLTGFATFATVAMLSAQTSARQLAAVQEHIQEGIASKGRVLTRQHALALRGMLLDNAFTDMQRLVEQAVREDPDLVYGLFVSSEHDTLAASRRDAAPALADSELQPPARQAWRELGLLPEEVLTTRESVRRIQRLGQDLLEVAVPVTGEGGESLGTIRYALSTHPMREALARAEAEKTANLLISVAWIAALVSLTTVMGWLLSRLQAYRITHPVDQLTRAAHELASGKRAVRVDITSGDELELLGSSFNHMVEQLDVSYRELEQMNQTLEQKVDARTFELALKNRDMSLVLDNVDQAFLTLSPDGCVAGGLSGVVSEWFGECPPQAEFAAYIAQTSAAFGLSFEVGWSQVVDGILPLELTLDQLPKQLVAEGRSWSFRYLPFGEADRLDGVLVIAAETTLELAREREEAEQRELMQSFARLMRDRKAFLDFVDEAGTRIGDICGRRLDDQPLELKSALHTLKGNAAAMGLSVVAAHCHLLEEQLAADCRMAESGLVELSERWRHIHEHVLGLLPRDNQRLVEVPATEYHTLLRELTGDPSHAALLSRVRGWALEPAVQSLERLAEQAKVLARRLGKGELEVVVRAGSVRLDSDAWRPFFAELIHLIRNAVDHGIEEPEERERRGKSRGGRLVLSVTEAERVLSFEVSDDGRGIDWDLIRAKAESVGLPHATPAELLAVLCHPGLSTASEVSDISGRGMGMAAFERCLQRLQGRIEVQSSSAGTRWRIQFAAAAAVTSSQNPQALLASNAAPRRLATGGLG